MGQQCYSVHSNVAPIQIGFNFLVPAHPGSPGQNQEEP